MDLYDEALNLLMSKLETEASKPRGVSMIAASDREISTLATISADLLRSHFDTVVNYGSDISGHFHAVVIR